MKKFLLVISAVALLFATSCNKNQNAPDTPDDVVLGDNEFLATIDNGANPQNAPRVNDGMSTMTTINADRYVIWQQNDQIAINGSIYTTSKSGNSVVFSGGTATGSEFHAFYPASIAGNGAAGTLPAEQIFYSNDNVSHLPMYAHSTNNQLSFNNICAVLKIQIPEFVQGGVSNIEISSERRMNGAFSVVNNVAVMPEGIQADSERFIGVRKSDYSPFSTSDVIYVAVPAGQYGSLTISFLTVNFQSVWSNSIPCTLVANRIYPVTISEPDIPGSDAFHFTALENGTQISLVSEGADNLIPSLQYCTYRGGAYSNWTNYQNCQWITIDNGEKVFFRATQDQTFSRNSAMTQVSNRFQSAGQCNVGGRLAYLISPNGEPPMVYYDVNNHFYHYAFQGLFQGMQNLISASDLIFPPGLNVGCYYCMFRDCYCLTSVPQLTAQELRENCYFEMFRNCYQLNNVMMSAMDVSAQGCLSNWLTGAATQSSSTQGTGCVSISGTIYDFTSGAGQIIKQNTPQNWQLFNQYTGQNPVFGDITP